jgi:eukaryotic-like serine/threonine-protein kinase
MGEVYRAHDSRLGRDVAIKILRDGSATDPDRLRRFTQEARAVAALNHPNILTIFEVAEVDGVPYMATELVEGETLRQRLAAGPVPVNDALEIAVQIADGLAHAHDARIVHRDLKPNNVMLKPDGLVKILDFGLGKVLEPVGIDTNATTVSMHAGAHTTTGTILGTAGYMSPEQVTGKPVDGRSDQFAFGALLYEMLTGRRAFNKDTTIETISSVLSDEPKPPLATLAPSTPAPLVAVVERCLAKNPADRYASTRDLAHDLEVIRRDVLGSKAGSSLFVRPVPRRAMAAIAAVLAVAVAAGLATLFLMRRPSAQVQQIAVLPFTNIQRDPGNDAFADGIVELLTTNLTQLEKTSETLRVVPASDVRRYGVVSAKEARQTFGATLVVSGSIQRTADVVRLTLNLIDSATQQQRNARVIDAKADNPLALQDQAFAVLASMLGAGIEPATRTALQTGSTQVPGAYDFYVQGRGYLQRYERLENVDNAINLFRRAIEVDDHFALAQASLGEALWRKYELTKDTALIADARAACAKATAINDQTAPVHVTLSMIARGTGEYETAVVEAKRALDLDPVGGDSRRELARAYESLGLVVEAEETYKDAIAARPGDWSGYNALGAFYYGRKKYAEALESFRRAAELTPDNPRAYSNIGGILFYLERYDEARAQFEKSVALKPTSDALSNLGTLYFRKGRFNDAARAFEQSAAMSPNDYVLWANLGSAYAQAGNTAGSMSAYRKAVDIGERQRSVNPRRASLVAELAGFHAILGDATKAEMYERQALQLAPSDPNVMVSVALAHNTLNDSDGAVAWLLKALDAGYPSEDIRQKYAIRNLLKDPRLQSRLEPGASSARR